MVFISGPVAEMTPSLEARIERLEASQPPRVITVTKQPAVLTRSKDGKIGSRSSEEQTARAIASLYNKLGTSPSVPQANTLVVFEPKKSSKKKKTATENTIPVGMVRYGGEMMTSAELYRRAYDDGLAARAQGHKIVLQHENESSANSSVSHSLDDPDLHALTKLLNTSEKDGARSTLQRLLDFATDNERFFSDLEVLLGSRKGEGGPAAPQAKAAAPSSRPLQQNQMPHCNERAGGFKTKGDTIGSLLLREDGDSETSSSDEEDLPIPQNARRKAQSPLPDPRIAGKFSDPLNDSFPMRSFPVAVSRPPQGPRPPSAARSGPMGQPQQQYQSRRPETAQQLRSDPQPMLRQPLRSAAPPEPDQLRRPAPPPSPLQPRRPAFSTRPAPPMSMSMGPDQPSRPPQRPGPPCTIAPHPNTISNNSAWPPQQHRHPRPISLDERYTDRVARGTPQQCRSEGHTEPRPVRVLDRQSDFAGRRVSPYPEAQRGYQDQNRR